MNSAGPLGLFALDEPDCDESEIDFRFPEMRQREELVNTRDLLRQEAKILIHALTSRRRLYHQHKAAQQAFGELCGSRLDIGWEIDGLERLLTDPHV